MYLAHFDLVISFGLTSFVHVALMFIRPFGFRSFVIDPYQHIFTGMPQGLVYKPPVSWLVFCVVLAVINEAWALVLGIGCAVCT